MLPKSDSSPVCVQSRTEYAWNSDQPYHAKRNTCAYSKILSRGAQDVAQAPASLDMRVVCAWSFSLHAYSTIKACDLTVHVSVQQDGLHERCELVGLSKSRRERDGLAKTLPQFLWCLRHHRSLEDAWTDGAHSDPQWCKVSCHRKRHTDNGALRGCVRTLACLSIECCDRCSMYNDAPLAGLLVCFSRCHALGSKA